MAYSARRELRSKPKRLGITRAPARRTSIVMVGRVPKSCLTVVPSTEPSITTRRMACQVDADANAAKLQEMMRARIRCSVCAHDGLQSGPVIPTFNASSFRRLQNNRRSPHLISSAPKAPRGRLRRSLARPGDLLLHFNKSALRR